MATAIAGGIIANGVTEILKKLSSVVTNEITLVWDFNDELKNLQSTLNMIMAVMEDAEKKQLSSKAVRLWMEELKAIAYDAEDVLDEYAYEVILRKLEKNKSTVFNKVRNAFSSSKPSFKVIRKLAHQIKEINEQFNNIANRMNNLGLQIINMGSSSSSQDELMMKNRETNSFVPQDWKIVGRENDKSTIIKMLLEEENTINIQDGGGKHVSVIPIVGMGGLGKTTMAQQIYNDEAVQKHFELKIWICVSDPFDIKKLWKNIGKSIRKQSKEEYDDATTMNAITHLLQDDVKGKKFILVLDDVWNENHADWYKFKTPLMFGVEGSKILVTTRSVKVAELMEDKFPHYGLGILNENDCWSLFKEITFGSAVGATETPKLVEIGKEMVNRCKGLPLAVVFLGSMMRSKKKEEEWKIIRDTKIWHEYGQGKNSQILPSLSLSYDNLPSHLKVCFSYCCLLPKDFEIHRETLIRLWMAEGFLIESPGENAMSMEEIGNEYFHSLLSSFFFQDVKKNKNGDVVTCKMHDLVHDLARSVIGKNECLIVENADDICCISEETRRLNLLVDLRDEEMLAKVLEALKKAKKLRTIFANEIRIDIGIVFKENKRLRVLDLSGSYPYVSVGGLKHLRYLDVHTGDLKFVWYFEVDRAPFLEGIGRLSFLQTMSDFNAGNIKKKKKNARGGIEQLEGLNLLRGDLSIRNMRPILTTSGKAACRANLKEKKNLRSLWLSWQSYPISVMSGSSYLATAIKNNAEAVLEGLRPHPNLRTLWIESFQGSKLPRWTGDSSCLPNLEELTVSFSEWVENLEQGFGALPSLRSLGLNNLIALKEWVVPVPPPLLEEIDIDDCRLLNTITPTTTIFPSLKVLSLKYIQGRVAKTLVINNFNSLTSLRLDHILNLVSLPHQGLIENNNTLLSLVIESCEEFEGFFPPLNNDDDDVREVVGEGGGQQVQQQISQLVSSSSSSSSSSSLQSLELYDCPVMRYYPNFRSLTSLRTLEIEECKESESLLTCLSSSSSSSFEHLEYVKILKNKKASLFEKEEVVLEWRKSESSFKE